MISGFVFECNFPNSARIDTLNSVPEYTKTMHTKFVQNIPTVFTIGVRVHKYKFQTGCNCLCRDSRLFNIQLVNREKANETTIVNAHFFSGLQNEFHSSRKITDLYSSRITLNLTCPITFILLVFLPLSTPRNVCV